MNPMRRRSFMRGVAGVLAGGAVADAGADRSGDDAAADPDRSVTMHAGRLTKGVLTLGLEGPRPGDTIRVSFSAPLRDADDERDDRITWTWTTTLRPDDVRTDWYPDGTVDVVADMEKVPPAVPELWLAARVTGVELCEVDD